jgi:hypothetical protein
MFTGRWPSELFEHPEQQLNDSVPTLAEYLGTRGYATAGFVANTFYCNSGFGLARGFDHYEDFYQDFGTSPGEILRHSDLARRLIELVGDAESIRPDGRKNADRINADFLTWQGKKPDRPFFAFLNYLDAHAPYIAPPNATKHFGLRPTDPADFKVLNEWQKLSVPPEDPRRIELARDAYDDCIAYLDEALGRLFDELERRGVMDQTLVIVTADHGEEIGEHKLVGHGRSLYREELHVPLLMARPGSVPAGKDRRCRGALRRLAIPGQVDDRALEGGRKNRTDRGFRAGSIGGRASRKSHDQDRSSPGAPGSDDRDPRRRDVLHSKRRWVGRALPAPVRPERAEEPGEGGRGETRARADPGTRRPEG